MAGATKIVKSQLVTHDEEYVAAAFHDLAVPPVDTSRTAIFANMLSAAQSISASLSARTAEKCLDIDAPPPSEVRIHAELGTDHAEALEDNFPPKALVVGRRSEDPVHPENTNQPNLTSYRIPNQAKYEIIGNNMVKSLTLGSRF